MAKKSPRLIKIIKEYVKGLKKILKVEKVIFFGSAARGKMHRDSDIDLIILSPDFRKMEFMKRLVFLTHQRQGKARKVPMDILGYTKEEFERLSKESIVLGEAKKEGVVIK